MKILFVLGLPNPFSGAAWTRIGFLAKAWASTTTQVDVLGTVTPKSIKHRGIHSFGKIGLYNSIPHLVSSHPFFFALHTMISFAVTFLFLFVKRPNIVIASMPPGEVGLGAIVACKLSRTKYVVDCRDKWEDYEFNKRGSGISAKIYLWIKTLMSKVLQKSTLVVTVTTFLVKELNLRGIKNVELISNGADITVFKLCNREDSRKKLGLNPDDFIIVYTGLIGDYYPLDSPIRALTKLEHSLRDKTRFLIVGSGHDLPRLLRMTENLGLEENVLYLGYKNDMTEFVEIVSAADVGIVPSVYCKGQLPVKFFEYGACGLPTIAVAPEDSLLSMLIKENEVGLSLLPTSEDSLAESIAQLYENKSLRNYMGKRAKDFVEKNFDRNLIAKKFSKIIKNYFDLEIY